MRSGRRRLANGAMGRPAVAAAARAVDHVQVAETSIREVGRLAAARVAIMSAAAVGRRGMVVTRKKAVIVATVGVFGPHSGPPFYMIKPVLSSECDPDRRQANRLEVSDSLRESGWIGDHLHLPD